MKHLIETLKPKVTTIDQLVFKKVKPLSYHFKLVNHYKGLPHTQPLIGYRQGLDSIIVTDGKSRLSALAQRLEENPDEFSDKIAVWVFNEESEARLAGLMVNTLRQQNNSYMANMANVQVLAAKYYSKEEISAITGLSKGQVNELLELAQLPDWLVEMVETGEIARGVARKLSRHRNEPFTEALFALVKEQGKITHADVDGFVNDYKAKQASELQSNLPGIEAFSAKGESTPPMARFFFDKAVALVGEEKIHEWLSDS